MDRGGANEAAGEEPQEGSVAMAKRGTGEGSIFKRSDGRWVASATVGYDVNGKQRRRVAYGKTRAAAAKELAKILGAAASGTLVDPQRITVAEYLKTWLADTVKGTRRKTTHATYTSFVRTHLAPRIGGFRLQALRPIHVQSLFAAMERDGIGARTRQAVFATLRRALADAVKMQVIATNPSAAIERPRVPRSAVTPLSADQVAQLFETARAMDEQRDIWRAARKSSRPAHRLSVEAVVAVAIGTGARQGELFGLKWSDYDAGSGVLRIARSIVCTGGKPEVGEGKTAASRRTIDLPTLAREALDRHREAQPATPHPSAWIFADWNGQPLRRQNFARRTWRPLVTRAGLPGARFHDLRHSCASFLLTRGVHPRVVQQILGHADVGTTLAVYSHVSEGLGKLAAGELDAALLKRLDGVPEAGKV